MTPVNKKLCLCDLATGLARIILKQPNLDLMFYTHASELLTSGSYTIKNSHIKLSNSKIKYVKEKLKYLYDENVEFDILEALSILFLSLSDLFVYSNNTEWVTPLYDSTLELIKLYDPNLIEHDKYNVAINSYLNWME